MINVGIDFVPLAFLIVGCACLVFAGLFTHIIDAREKIIAAIKATHEDKRGPR